MNVGLVGVLPRNAENETHLHRITQMDLTTLLIIVLVVMLLGGGWYGRGRWYGR
jgi:hypothetical protein